MEVKNKYFIIKILNYIIILLFILIIKGFVELSDNVLRDDRSLSQQRQFA